MPIAYTTFQRSKFQFVTSPTLERISGIFLISTFVKSMFALVDFESANCSLHGL